MINTFTILKIYSMMMEDYDQFTQKFEVQTNVMV